MYSTLLFYFPNLILMSRFVLTSWLMKILIKTFKKHTKHSSKSIYLTRTFIRFEASQAHDETECMQSSEMYVALFFC